MAQCHDPHSIKCFAEQQVVGKFLKIGASPAAGVEVETLGMRFHLAAELLEFRPEIITEREFASLLALQREFHKL